MRTLKYCRMLSTRPSNLENAQVEFEIHLEERLKTFLNSNPEELQCDEEKPKKRQKKKLSNVGDDEPKKIPSRKKPKKRDPGLISFLTTYHKSMWTTKYNCAFIYEDDDDDIEIGEEVTYNFNCKPLVYVIQYATEMEYMRCSR
jgi:hypothetical protein